MVSFATSMIFLVCCPLYTFPHQGLYSPPTVDCLIFNLHMSSRQIFRNLSNLVHQWHKHRFELEEGYIAIRPTKPSTSNTAWKLLQLCPAHIKRKQISPIPIRSAVRIPYHRLSGTQRNKDTLAPSRLYALTMILWGINSRKCAGRLMIYADVLRNISKQRNRLSATAWWYAGMGITT